MPRACDEPASFNNFGHLRFIQGNRLFQIWVPRFWSLDQTVLRCLAGFPNSTALSKSPKPWHPIPSFHKTIALEIQLRDMTLFSVYDIIKDLSEHK